MAAKAKISLIIAFAFPLLMGLAPGSDHTPRHIHAGQIGTLTVHKRSAATAGDLGDGTRAARPPGVPVAGVEFTIRRLTLYTPANGEVEPIDLATPRGWELAAAITLDSALAAARGLPADVSFGESAGFPEVIEYTREQTTDRRGQATFDRLPVGLYLVTESGRAASVAGAPGSAPFLVTLPLGANLDPHVYAPADTTQFQIEVDLSKTHTVGDLARFAVIAQVPMDPLAREHYQIVIDPGELEVVNDPAAEPHSPMVQLWDPTTSHLEAILVPGLDYELAFDAGISVTFTEFGRRQLASAAAGWQVRLLFGARLTPSVMAAEAGTFTTTGQLITAALTAHATATFQTGVVAASDWFEMVPPDSRVQVFASEADALGLRDPIMDLVEVGGDYLSGDLVFGDYWLVVTDVPRGYPDAIPTTPVLVTLAAETSAGFGRYDTLAATEVPFTTLGPVADQASLGLGPDIPVLVGLAQLVVVAGIWWLVRRRRQARATR